jgi:hypothetical protein
MAAKTKPNALIAVYAERAASLAAREMLLEERKPVLHLRIAEARAERQMLEELRARDPGSPEWEAAFRAYRARAAARDARDHAEDAMLAARKAMLDRGCQVPGGNGSLPG